MNWPHEITLLLLSYFPTPTSCSSIFDRSNGAQQIAQHRTLPNSTASFNTDQSGFGHPYCFPPASHPYLINIEICRPILESILQLGDPLRDLYFIYGKEPRVRYPSPSTLNMLSVPPFHFTLPGVACEIYVSTVDRTRVAEYSWQQVCDLAYSVLVECTRHGGSRGGRQQISSDNGWFVFVAGPVSLVYAPSGAPSVNTTSLSSTITSDIDLYVGHGPIHCHDIREYHQSATVDLCRPVLAYIRSWPSFSRTQTFEEFMLPRVEMDGKRMYPPFTWLIRGGKCVVELRPLAPGVVDRFSFSDVKNLATDVLESCHQAGSHGGTARVGDKHGWVVNVFGSKIPTSDNREEVSAS